MASATQRPSPRRARLRRSDCSGPGFRRIRRGRGFQYVDSDGNRIEEAEELERFSALAIPPAWKDVWICPDPSGHLQATGIDAAGRKQYLYHASWREHRDREKFERMVRFGEALPRLRRRMHAEMNPPTREPTRERVLACATRLLDVGLFRIGSEQYAEEDHGVGLATVRRQHVTVDGDSILFDYPAKGGIRRLQTISEPSCVALIRTLKRRRSGPDEQLLVYRNGRRWVPLRSDDINEYLKHELGDEFSAKDFRTWNATVLAAVSVAAQSGGRDTKTARKRAIDGAVRGVAELLGNTPAVARRAYIDPRVFDRYLSGWTIARAIDDVKALDPADDRTRARLERAVLDLLADDRRSRALERSETPLAA